MGIPFHKPYITEEEISGVIDTIRSGWLTMGPKTIEFEKKIKEYIGSKHAISMNSGTACLHLALKAVGVKEGDEVIIPSVTFTATAEVVTYFNAKPVLIDVEKKTHNMDVARIEPAITEKTRVILPVHYAGQPCDMREIMKIAKKYDLYVVEDAAHSLPAWYGIQNKGRKNDEMNAVGEAPEERTKGQIIGAIGDITCFSFYATKTLSTGEGGMATTENSEWANQMRILRLHGISQDAWNRYSKEGSWYYDVVEAGYKYNMTDIQAALGLAQLKKLEWMWQKRREIASKYSQAFESIAEINTPYVKPDRESAWHLYVITLNLEMLNIDRGQFIQELARKGIGTSVHFIPLYRHPYYKKTFSYCLEDFPSSEWVYERMISLPIYPGLGDEDVWKVVYAVTDVVKKNRK